MRCVVKAHHSVPYAWDEPILEPHLTCVAPGGSTATYNMDVTGRKFNEIPFFCAVFFLTE